MKSVLMFIALVGAIGSGAAYWFNHTSAAVRPNYRTAPIEREDLVVAINATGTVEPEEVVDVGAQVAGRIVEFGKDPKSAKTIDYNSVVEPGTLLARIDDALYKEETNVARAQVAKARAAAEQRKTQHAEMLAGIERAEADLRQMEARFAQTERDWGRAQKLLSGKALSQQEFDTFRGAFETAQATVGVGKAAVLQATSAAETAKAAVAEGQADIEAAQAVLNRAERNLEYTTIKSPITGVIVARRVNIGQTVVASLNAPSLFLIAKDLRRIQVWASVNEADIGRIRKGQPVTFTVDTIAGETFAGSVNQIRLDATMTQNVVTYTVIVDAENTDGRLLPYLTANLQFEVSRHPQALVVPSTALRWKPHPELISPEYRASFGGETNAKGSQKTVVWVVQGEFVRPIEVRLGAVVGGHSQVIGDELQEGMAVIVGEQSSSGPSGVVNPLTPKMFGGSKPQG